MSSSPATPGPCCAKRGLFNLFSCREEGLYPCFECEGSVCNTHAVQLGDGKIYCPDCHARENDHSDDTSGVSARHTGAAAGGMTAFNDTDHRSVSARNTRSDSDSSSSSFRDS